MTIYKDPYTFSPTKFILEKKPEWIEQIKPKVSKLIETLKFQLIKEAEYEHEEDLLTPEYMYTCFKQNVEEHGYFSNWTILKYFLRMYKIKILQEMIGEWTYTEEDVEMFNYFNTVEVDDKNKASEKKLKFLSCLEDEAIIQNYNNSIRIYCEFESDNPSDSNTGSLTYQTFFGTKYSALENLKRRAKLNKLFTYNGIENEDIMGPDYYKNVICKHIKNGSFSKIIKFDIDYIKSNWEKEQEKQEKTRNTAISFYDGMAKFVDKDPLYHKLQSEMNLMYYRLIQEYKKTDEGHELYELLNDEQKARLENMSYFE